MKISVAMTTHNGALYLREQVDSILAQTRMPDEVIICDDQSTDVTPELLREFSTRSPVPMTVVFNEQRLGSTKNFEQAIQLCSGDVIALSDQDDVWRPHKLAVIERRFKENPDLGLVFSNGDLIDQNGAQVHGDIWSRFWFGRRLQRLLDSPQEAYDLLLSRYFITGATIAFRSSFRNMCVPIPDGISTFIHDRWIAVMIGAVARVDRINERLIAYRLHAQQQMGVGKRPIVHHHLIPYSCSTDYRALSIMRRRLGETAPGTANPQFLHALDIRQRHLAARAALSRNPIWRLKGVALEYLSGRYRRYPLGRADAVKDLLVGTR
jgi:glycosyltransferase involved in cell wall biosynthesis